MKQILAIALVLAFVSARAQDQFPDFEKKTFIRNGDTLLYRILTRLIIPKEKNIPSFFFFMAQEKEATIIQPSSFTAEAFSQIVL